MNRDYKREYRLFHGKPEQRKRRSERNISRKLLIQKRGKAALKNKDVHHKNGNTADMRMSNLAIVSKSYNRARKA